ncbi:hypothetical protein GGF46_001786 [Coemansia sp. RSA 552]|nr:hypothetical protein GGF46_001786 [Coemansia sp. RSA 552]
MRIAELLRRAPTYTVDDKVVLITGALTAVGRRLALELVRKGARVSLVDSIADGSGERFSRAINAKTEHDTSLYLQTDLRAVHDIRLMIEATVLHFGRLDVLVNNAERYADEIADEEDAQRICDSIDVNLRAPIVAAWVFARYLSQSGNEGVAVNVAAMAGLLPGRGREVYGAANAGLIHFTEASRAMAPRLRVCALAPYYVDTPVDMTGRRLLPGQRLGGLLLTLSSDQVVRSVIRCIEDTSLSGKTVVIAGESSYTSTWTYLLSHCYMFLIMVCSMLVLLVQRVFGRRVAAWLRKINAFLAEEMTKNRPATAAEDVYDVAVSSDADKDELAEETVSDVSDHGWSRTYRVLSHILEQSEYELEYCKWMQQKHGRRKAWYGGGGGDTEGLAADLGSGLFGDTSALSIESLSQLALKSDTRLRKAASDLMFDSAMQPRMLALIIKTASDKSDAEKRLRAVTLLQALAQSAPRLRRIARAGGVEALVGCMWEEGEKELVLRAAATLMEFIGHQDSAVANKYRKKAARCGALRVVYRVLRAADPDESDGRRSDGVIVTVCAGIAKLYALRTAFHEEMIDLGYLPALLGVAKHAVADLELTRATMESIVRLCTYLSTYRGNSDEPCPQMVAMLDMGAVDVIGACIRQDDQGVSSWGIGLLHEFVSRGVGKQQLAASPNIVRWLCRKLSTTKYAYTNQLILRSLWCLCSASKDALADVAQPPNLRRVLSIFVVEDDAEAHHWSIALIAKISIYPSAHRWIIESPLPRALHDMVTKLPQNLRLTLLPEVANIISRMCHSILIAPLLSSHPEIAETCRLLMASDIENAHLAAIMAIINATATSRDFLEQVVTDPIRSQMLDMLIDFDHEPAQNYASKGLIALLSCEFIPADQIVFRGLVPYLHRIVKYYMAAFDPYMRLRHPAFNANLADAVAAAGDWSALRLCHHTGIASVLFTALQVYLATEDQRSHFLATEHTDEAIAALFDFQSCLLLQLALTLSHVLDIGEAQREYVRQARQSSSNARGLDVADVLDSSLGSATKPIEPHSMRLEVNAFIIAYYLDCQDDPHFVVSLADSRKLQTHTLRETVSHPAESEESGEDMAQWHDVPPRYSAGSAPASTRQSTTDSLSSEKEEDTGAPRKGFVGDMASQRLRCVLPALRIVLGALADSLEPCLMLQRPDIARQALALMRIICREFPDIRGIAMRVLAMLDLRVLSPADMAGLMHMCSSYLADTATPDASRQQKLAINVDRESVRRCIHDLQAIVHKLPLVNEEYQSYQPQETPQDRKSQDDAPWLETLPVCFGSAADAKRTRREYFQRYPEVEPASLMQFGRIYAQFALDRYTAGWRTCRELYSCVDAPQTVDQGACCWIIDRSGPRGTGRHEQQQGPAVAIPRHPGGAVDTDDRDLSRMDLLEPGRTSTARFSGDPLLNSSSSSISSSSVRISGNRRSSSPFPTTIVSDPDIDYDEGLLPAVSGPPATLVSPPGIMHHTNAPYYPSFVVLGDGCTIWNSTWKFESARMRTGIDGRLGGIHRFHVLLLTSGLIQVGWCSNMCCFYPESGEGVGDDFESVAYDGHRKSKWFGTSEDKNYGERWHSGDVITSELDLDNGRVVFYRNGKSLGLAFGINEQGVMEGGKSGFQGLSRDRTWYPAFSFASEQGLVFLGSDDAEQVKHPESRTFSMPAVSGASHRSHDSSASLASYGYAGIPSAERPGSQRKPQSSSSSSSHTSTQSDQTPRAFLGSVPAESIDEMRRQGVVAAFRIHFEFQDLDMFPCISLALPSGKGQITIGPVTVPENLSTYLQPQWWAVWTTSEATPFYGKCLRDVPSAQLLSWFVRSTKQGEDSCRQSAVLTSSSMSTTATWVYVVVLRDGRVCLATINDGQADRGAPDALKPVVFDIGASAASNNGHVWVPTASAAVVSFDLVPICTQRHWN